MSAESKPLPAGEAHDGASLPRLVRHLNSGDTLPLHKFSGWDIPLDTLYRWFYEAHSKDDDETMEQLEMAIEEQLQVNNKDRSSSD